MGGYSRLEARASPPTSAKSKSSQSRSAKKSRQSQATDTDERIDRMDVTFHTQGPLPPLPSGPGVPSLTGAAMPSRQSCNGGYYVPSPSQSAQPTGPTALSAKPTAYNDFFQRLLQQSGTPGQQRPRAVARHPIAQSYSSHYYEDPGPPTNRSGRIGASWRHVKQCTGNLGNHICFIDGVIKQEDVKYYPPNGHLPPANRFVSLSANRPTLARSLTTLPANKFAQNARLGLKYWSEDRKPMPSSKPTISGRLMKLGVGH